MKTQLSFTEYAVLGLLSLGERSGYELNSLAQRSIGCLWRPARSKIYSLLPQLVERGLAEASAVVREGRPDKTIYRITESGEAVLRDWIASPETFVGPARDGLLLKLFFGREEDAAALEAQVRERKHAAQAQLAALAKIEAGLDRESDDDFFPRLTVRYGLADARSTIAWADEALELIARRRSGMRGAAR